uniref:Uncharacterized protein n=1 Tax=Corethron hystrix TaxID=216773 RepID=A0A7S1FYY9_9STRA
MRPPLLMPRYIQSTILVRREIKQWMKMFIRYISSRSRGNGGFNFLQLAIGILALMAGQGREVDAFTTKTPSELMLSTRSTNYHYRRHEHHLFQRHESSVPSSTTNMYATKNKDVDRKEGQNDDPLAVFGPLRLIVPFLFLGQICFLAVAKQTSGLDALTQYGELGNAYIRRNGGYDQSRSFLERQRITSAGQKNLGRQRTARYSQWRTRAAAS